MNSINLHMKSNVITIILMIFLLLGAALQTGAEEPRFLEQSFPDGFKHKEPVTFYDPQNLYEYINGQAVFYLSYGFKVLEHGYYEKGEATFYVDVYELNSRLSAFGAFRQQREQEAAVLGIGCEGAITDYLAVFHKGSYYVEIIPMSGESEDMENMKLLASHVEKRVPGAVELPPEVGLFPNRGLIPGSERYVDENLISYSFMGRGLSARYLPEGEDQEFRIFLSITDSGATAQEIFKTYREKLENSETVTIGQIKGVKGKEPYRGITILTVWEKYVFGCLGVEKEAQSIMALNALLERLKQE